MSVTSTATAQLPVEPVAALCRALGDPTRLRLVALLSQGELCVCHLHTALGLPQPAVSRHLAVLRAAGLVASRRHGTWVHYRLVRQTDPGRRRLLASLVRALPATDLRADRARLCRQKGPGA